MYNIKRAGLGGELKLFWALSYVTKRRLMERDMLMDIKLCKLDIAQWKTSAKMNIMICFTPEDPDSRESDSKNFIC